MATKKASDENGAETGDAPVADLATAKRSRKLFIALGSGAALLLAAGGGVGWVLAGPAGDAAQSGHGTSAPPEDAAHDGNSDANTLGAMVDVPPMITNMRRSGSESGYLKLRFMLVATSPEKAEAIKLRLPALLDRFQPFLRELRPEDLNGAAAVYRIKEELLYRARQVAGPDMVDDLLIQDLLQQ